MRKIKNGGWEDCFLRQVDRGSFWKKLHGDECDRQTFLMRSDALYICKKAQADAYENVIELLDEENDKESIKKINKIIAELWNNDDSALGC